MWVSRWERSSYRYIYVLTIPVSGRSAANNPAAMTVGRTPGGRSAPALIGEAFRLYARFPLLFLLLAAGVVVPYRLIVLAATGAGPYTEGGLPVGTSLLLTLIGWVVIDPLVSALHVHAVADVEEGRTPQLGPVTRRGLGVLPLVVAATIMSGLATIGGFLLLVVPGVYVLLRLVVVAQAAAIERQTWLDALRRSWTLTEGRVLHVLSFFLCVGVVSLTPALLVSSALPAATTVGSFLLGVAIQVLVLSFTALATALLYFDLRARKQAAQGRRRPEDRSGSGEPQHELDPRRYSDDDRPKGWYVDPTQPQRMRYWGGSESPTWTGSTRTPRKLREAWESEREGAGRPR